MTADAILAATIPSVLPTLMVLVGILTNKNDINHVRTEIASMRGEIASVRTEISGVRKELSAEISGVRAELGAFKVQSHHDIMTLTGLYHDIDKRVSRLEDKG